MGENADSSQRTKGAGTSRQARAKPVKPRLPLREEIAQLDMNLLAFIDLRQLFATICATEQEFAPMLGIWQENTDVLASLSPIVKRFFELLKSSSFATHGKDHPEYTKWKNHLRGEYGQESLEELDSRLLRDLSKRAKLLGKMSQGGRVSIADEKFLRENWQNEVARRKGNATLAGPVFMCIQGVAPHAESPSEKKGGQPFSLYSAPGPVHFCINAPLDDFASRAWLYLAVSAGQPINLHPVVQNEPLSDFLHILSQLGANIQQEGDRLLVQAAPPLPRPDRVVHAGGDVFNLYLLACHYLGAGSRIKITGDTSLQLMNFTFMRRILPELGARIVHMVPKNSGLPFRLECSGILPPVFTVLPELPQAFVKALLLSAPFYQQPFAVDLGVCPERSQIISAIMPIFEQAGITCNIVGDVFNFAPASVLLPPKPIVPLDLQIASFLLAIAQACSGEVELAGMLPVPGTDVAGHEMLMKLCVEWSRTDYGLRSVSTGKPLHFDLEPAAISFAENNSFMQALFCCFAAITAHREGKASLPKNLLTIAKKNGFLEAACLAANRAGLLEKNKAQQTDGWQAPDAWWAMALGLVALVKSRHSKIQLGNPAIIRQIWAPFWQLLNSLTMPLRSLPAKEPAIEKKSRRIHTQAVAVPPQIREEDWER